MHIYVATKDDLAVSICANETSTTTDECVHRSPKHQAGDDGPDGRGGEICPAQMADCQVCTHALMCFVCYVCRAPSVGRRFVGPLVVFLLQILWSSEETVFPSRKRSNDDTIVGHILTRLYTGLGVLRQIDDTLSKNRQA